MWNLIKWNQACPNENNILELELDDKNVENEKHLK